MRARLSVLLGATTATFAAHEFRVNDMTKKKGNEGWLIAGLLVAGLGLLYYVQTGFGKQNDSALLPNTIEGKIDALIAALNNRFGKRWVDLGVAALKYYLQNALPASLVTLVDVVAAVENVSEQNPMTSYDKQRLSFQMARTR